MVSLPVSQVLIGMYLGLLAGIFPAFISFIIGFVFKYLTSVTVPGLGVIVISGGLAGVSGGLLALLDPTLAQGWGGIVAILVILMFSLWAHSQGDKLGERTPRTLTLRTLRESRLSGDLIDLFDSYGQVTIRPSGEIADLEGYPPLPSDLRSKLASGAWTFPGNLAIDELETRLEGRLEREYELAAVTATLTRDGRARIAAAPSAAGLSRRVAPGHAAASVRTLLPTGLARGDAVTLALSDENVTGQVVSARSDHGRARPSTAIENPADGAGSETADGSPTRSRSPTTDGGPGRLTVELPTAAARRVIQTEFAPVTVESRGGNRVDAAIALLEDDGNAFRTVTLKETSGLVGQTIGSLAVRDRYQVAILAVRRPSERIVAPPGETLLQAGDVLIVVGMAEDLDAFAEVAG